MSRKYGFVWVVPLRQNWVLIALKFGIPGQNDPEGYKANVSKSTWDNMKRGRVNIESLYFGVLRGGWVPDDSFTTPSPEDKARAQERWDKAKPSNPKHPYPVAKGITSPAMIGTLRQGGNQLLVPLKKNKELVMLQATGA